MRFFFTNRSDVLAIALLFSGVFFRVIRSDLDPGMLPNFSPLMAASICGALFLSGWSGLLIPLAALLISDSLLNLQQGISPVSVQMFWSLPCYLFAVGLGWKLRDRKASLPFVLCATFVASVFFYLVTNTGSWLGLAAYPQNLAGWVQALTVGLPGYPPTWVFFRNSVISDLLFASLFVCLERSLVSGAVKLPVEA